MILFIAVCVKELFQLGKAYPWPKPKVCPGCQGGALWGHGFVPAYFDGYRGQVWLRRFRCPQCRCVVRQRPITYWSRFQASRETIRDSISQRLTTGRWPTGPSRSRQGYWLRGLTRKVCAYLGTGNDLLEGFDLLLQMEIVPVGRSI